MGQRLSIRKTISAAVAGMFLFLLLPAVALAEDNQFGGFEMEEIFHVYYGDERLGTVQYEDTVTNYLDELLETKQLNGKEHLTYQLAEEVKLIPELVFEVRGSDEDMLTALEDIIEIKVEAFDLTIEDEVIGSVAREQAPEEIERMLYLTFFDEKELAAYDAYIENDEEASVSAGDSLIIDLGFDRELDWNEVLVNEEELLSAEELTTIILEGTLEKDIYEIEEGDILSTIASDHDLSHTELLEINESLEQDSVLQIGQEINVTVPVSYLNIWAEKIVKEEKTIRHEQITKENETKWQGESSVRQSGNDGKKTVEEKIVYHNDQVQEREIISEEIIQEAEDRIVVHGTKTSPSRGTGELIYPANGGYISSQYGMRNGRMHNGIDIARPAGFQIYAADNGVVSSAGWENGYGNTIRINHNNGMETVYAHLKSINVSVGQTVGQGRQIGVMGTTGRSSGIHLHFEVIQNGSSQNPMNYLR